MSGIKRFAEDCYDLTQWADWKRHRDRLAAELDRAEERLARYQAPDGSITLPIGEFWALQVSIHLDNLRAHDMREPSTPGPEISQEDLDWYCEQEAKREIQWARFCEAENRRYIADRVMMPQDLAREIANTRDGHDA